MAQSPQLVCDFYVNISSTKRILCDDWSNRLWPCLKKIRSKLNSCTRCLYAFYCSLKIFVAGNSNCKHILVDTVHSWVSGATVAWANHFQITLSINNDWMEKSKFRISYSKINFNSGEGFLLTVNSNFRC